MLLQVIVILFGNCCECAPPDSAQLIATISLAQHPCKNSQNTHQRWPSLLLVQYCGAWCNESYWIVRLHISTMSRRRLQLLTERQT